MSATSLLTLLDDITAILDDVALMTKTAASKTAGVLGDDLAVNAEQVVGVNAERELPVVWAVAKGSLLNKLIIVPIALLLSAFLPWMITPLLMGGGLYLCFEGAEKIFARHQLTNTSISHHDVPSVLNSVTELLAFERAKINGAIRTDFVLSIEIIVLTLGTVIEQSLAVQVMVVSIIALAATIGVYGIVALIVKLDDAGLYLLKYAPQSRWPILWQTPGRWLVNLAPYLLKLLTVVGTIAMFLVGGSILSHALPPITFILQQASGWIYSFLSVPAWALALSSIIMPLLFNLLLGLLVGSGLLVLVPKLQAGYRWLRN